MQPPLTWADIARRANDVEPTVNPQTDLRPQGNPIEATTVSEQVPQEEEAQDHAELLANPTLHEDMDYEAIRNMILKYDRALERRVKRHSNETAAVETQRLIVDDHVATLSLLQRNGFHSGADRRL